jgi:hypothetical protein
MNERIRLLAISTGIFDSLCDPFDELKNGDCYSSVIIDLEKFAQLIVRECAEIADVERPNSIGCGYITKTKGMLIREHFGVE